MKLKFLAILGLLVMFSGNAMHTSAEMEERVDRCVNYMKQFRASRAAPSQEAFLKEKGGADAYFDNAKKILSSLGEIAISGVNPKDNVDALADVLKDICDLGNELNAGIADSSWEFFTQCAFGILDDYYYWYGKNVDSEKDPRLLEYVDYLGYAVCDDWRVGS